MHPAVATIFTAAGLLALSATAEAQPAASCQASSGATAPTVVELYTSEGCSSCPPADKWLSTLKDKPDVLALAFHVNYWDKLGWPDRFATPEATSRQYALAKLAGSDGVYTPQVRAQGRDWREWPRLPGAAAGQQAAGAPPAVSLQRDGDVVTAQVRPGTGATASTASTASDTKASSFSGYWAVLENNHQSKVRSGENAGQTLRHDHVVRLYKPVPAWASAAGSTQRLQVSRGVPEHPRRVVFVVTDAVTERPLQAVSLGC